MRVPIAAALLGAVALVAHAQAPAVQAPAVQAPAVQAPAVQAPAVQAPAVQAASAWARPTAPRQQTGAAYLELRSDAGDRLLRASTPVAERVEVHETRMDGDVMRMREVAALELPPGQTVALAPGRHHLMLVGLKGRLMPGQQFPLRLEFERAAPLEVVATVRQTGTGAAGATDRHTGHDH